MAYGEKSPSYEPLSRFYFSFSGAPDPPYNVEVVHYNDLEVDLEWLPGENGNSEITEYTISAKTAFPELGWKEMKTVPASSTSATVSLKAYNTYTFRVTATNAVGTSQPSEMSAVHMTPQGRPIMNPAGVRVSRPEPGLLVIEWDVSVFSLVHCTSS